MTKRTAIIETQIWCYNENDGWDKDTCSGNEDWESPVIKQPIEERKKKFGDSLEEWGSKVLEAFEEIAEEWGEENCQDITDYHHLCDYTAKIIDLKEILEVPEDILDRIERLEGLIKESKKYIKKYEDMIAELLVKGEKMTDEDRELLMRLDEYIRIEKENIRKFESGIKRLKTEWGIE